MALAACGDGRQEAVAQAAKAQQLLDARDLKGAREAIAAAIAERDDIVDAHLLRGRIELAAGAREQAFDAYSDALALDATNREALQGVSQLGLSVGRFEEAEQAADQILVLQPEQPDALLVKGLLQLAKHRPADAETFADLILKADPSNQGGILLKIRAMFAGGRQDEALALVNKSAPALGDTPELALTLLELHRERSDADAMLRQFTKLRAFRPDDAALRLDEINSRYKMGDAAGARSLGTSLIGRKGGDEDVMAKLAELWREYDPTPLTPEQRARSAAAPMPARIATARFYLDRNEPQSAAETLRDAVGEDAEALRARIDLAQGRPAEARARVERVLAGDATQCDALAARAGAAIASGRPRAAIGDAQSLKTECPEREDGYLLLARAYSGLGDDAGVRRAFSDGVRALPQSTPLAAAFVRWLADRGEGSRAQLTALRLTRQAPALVSGWRLYAETCARVPEADCAAEAADGLAAAWRRYAIDLRPGEQPPNGLFGRLR